LSILIGMLLKDKKGKEVGFQLDVPPNLLVCHPFQPESIVDEKKPGQPKMYNRVTKIVVSHIFKSNAKPLLLTLTCEPTVYTPPPKKNVNKRGGDVEKEIKEMGNVGEQKERGSIIGENKDNLSVNNKDTMNGTGTNNRSSISVTPTSKEKQKKRKQKKRKQTKRKRKRKKKKKKKRKQPKQID